jgi:hypothetical protein
MQGPLPYPVNAGFGEKMAQAQQFNLRALDMMERAFLRAQKEFVQGIVELIDMRLHQLDEEPSESKRQHIHVKETPTKA